MLQLRLLLIDLFYRLLLAAFATARATTDILRGLGLGEDASGATGSLLVKYEAAVGVRIHVGVVVRTEETRETRETKSGTSKTKFLTS